MLRQLSKQLTHRQFHTSTRALAASLFKMPAMSPTMEFGGVENWKFKDGDSFSSGDVLLEIETDKATIDVEAQDDGKLFKILKNDGEKNIKVGEPIAVFAEPEDDLSTLEVPKFESSTPSPSPSPTASKIESSKPTSNPKKSSAPSSPQSSSPKIEAKEGVYQPASSTQTFFPSVAQLLSEHKISRETAISSIPASGANGRILKGDVLAYLGLISQESLDKVSNWLYSKTKLDLSNIEKITLVKKQPAKVKPTKPEPKTITKTFTLSKIKAFQEKADSYFSLQEYIQDASQRAEKYAYGQHEIKSDAYDPIFEDLVALPTNLERFSIELKSPKEQQDKIIRKPIDLIDELHQESDFFEDLIVAEPIEEEVTVRLTLNNVADSQEKAELYLKKFERYLYDL